MNSRRAFISSTVFLAIFILQEGLLSQIRLPLGGFSLFLIFSLCWAALSTPEMGAVTGFGAGILLDLGPSSPGPVGQWTLVLTFIGFGIAFLRYGDDSLRVNPLSVVLMVSIGVILTLTLYLFLGVLLGFDLGATFQLFKNILGSGLWTLVVAPFLLPFISRLHGAIYQTRESL